MGVKTAIIDQSWERRWAPYDQPTYQTVLDWVRPDDVVLELGAGDFRLARQLASKAERVYAIEINPALIALAQRQPQSDNMDIIEGNIYKIPFPKGINLAVLLMRHCQRFGFLIDKLTRAGFNRLVTNARWGLSPELINLQADPWPFALVDLGWYACWCGATGFVPGPPEKLSEKHLEHIHEVVDCPVCARKALPVYASTAN